MATNGGMRNRIPFLNVCTGYGLLAACRGKRTAQHSGPGGPEELAVCLDGHGSVRMLANGTGQTTDTWTYDAWGNG